MPSLMVGIPSFDMSVRSKCAESVGNAEKWRAMPEVTKYREMSWDDVLRKHEARHG